jgi:hypothetical protein
LRSVVERVEKASEDEGLFVIVAVSLPFSMQIS